MRRADRLFQIVQLLRSRRLRTAEDLAMDLGVSKRTIYRDIQDLQSSGVPVRGEAGVGYCLERGFELPPMTFTASEVEALALGARVAESWGDRDLAAAARSALSKVEGALPGSLRGLLRAAPLFAPRGSWADVATSGLSTLRQATAERRKVRFTYVRPDGDATERTVRPVGLYFWGRTWSLAAWCELRGGWRNFRVDRMQDLRLLADQFVEDEEVSLRAFVQYQERAAESCGYTPPPGSGPRA